MALKVEKPGKLPDDRDRYAGQCKLCGCRVSADDRNDLKAGYSGLDAQHGYYVDCPTAGCNRQIDMKKIVYRGN